MIKSINKEEIGFVTLLSVLPVFLVVVLSLLVMFTPIGENEIIQTGIVMGSSFVIIPWYLIKRKYNASLEDLGATAGRKSFLIIELLLLLVFVITVKIVANPVGYMTLVMTTLFVAVCEEFWARGCLFYIWGRLFENKLIVCLISTLIFVFVVHMNRGVLENALYRLPGALIMGLIYWKTGKLQYSIGFHFIYNILGSI